MQSLRRFHLLLLINLTLSWLATCKLFPWSFDQLIKRTQNVSLPRFKRCENSQQDMLCDCQMRRISCKRSWLFSATNGFVVPSFISDWRSSQSKARLVTLEWVGGCETLFTEPGMVSVRRALRTARLIPIVSFFGAKGNDQDLSA